MSAPLSPRELLTAYALELLDPEERAAVERALAADPALAAEHAEVVAHLALYERFPAAAEPPPFASVALRLPARRSRAWLGWSAAAAAILGIVVMAGLHFTERQRLAEKEQYYEALFPFAILGHGSEVAGGGPVRPGVEVSAERPAEVRLGERVRLVLADGAALRLVSANEVRLERGRAYFEVAPGPFRVRTARGDVDVLGTRFEVDVRDGLVVNVAEGRVRVGNLDVNPGQRLAGGVVSPTTEEAGTFFRRPVLLLEGPGSAKPGEPVLLRLVLENPTHLKQEVRGPETVATGALLTWTDPAGQVQSHGLDFARAVSGGLPALSPVVLGPRERRLTVFQVQVPSAPTGSWRLSALYRPQGEAPIASAPFTLEVR